MLTDHVMIITGASSGIGAATAIEAARNGIDCVITARREDKLNDVAASVRQLGRRCEIVVGDAAERGMADRLLDAAERAFGRFDFVFANAGYGLRHTAMDISEQAMREMFDVNFFACVDLLQKAARRLIAQNRRGHLLMCSSCLARFTVTGSALYCATKASQTHFCRAMNIELRERGIYVSSVMPIGTATEFRQASARRSGREVRPARTVLAAMFVQPPERVARAVIRCLRRPKPEVWTSLPTRWVMGLAVMFPRFGDLAMRIARRQREM
jgi:3-oxoacyl-[acyl-carrier protein] reductase